MWKCSLIGRSGSGCDKRQSVGLAKDKSCVWTSHVCGQVMCVDKSCVWTSHVCGQVMCVDVCEFCVCVCA